MDWEVILAAVILGLSLIVATKTWAKAKFVNRGLKCPHTWGLWETYQKGDLTFRGSRIGHYMEQRRECTMCGEVELREERLDA